jgi:UDP-N-acetylmuramoyl-tripeptide--D-alanyl-D-alanine ligase
MRDLTLHQLHQIVGGRLRLATLGPRDGEWTRVARIALDSRQLLPGEVFWALQGATHDASTFIESAFARGASGVIADKYTQPWPGCWSLEVDDSREALYQLARYRRDQFRGQLIALGGASGTATTRRMISAVLDSKFSGCQCPPRSNRLESIALGMMTLAESHDYAVFDLNLSAPGDVTALTAECEPTLGVVTDVARLRSTQAHSTVHNEAAQLLSHIPATGHLVLNGDDSAVRHAAKGCKAKVMWVGESEGCDLVASRVLSTQGRLSFVVDKQTFHVSAWGRHQLTSALCAIGVGQIFGMSLPEIARALEAFDPPPSKCDAISHSEPRAARPIAPPIKAKLSRPSSMPSAGDVIAFRPLVHKAMQILRFDGAQLARRAA